VQTHLDENTLKYGTRFSPVMPEGALRLGRKDIIDATYSFGYDSYAAFPVLISEFSLGSGFGQKTEDRSQNTSVFTNYNGFKKIILLND